MTGVNFINPYPYNNEKKYGLIQTLGLTVVISGSEYCDHNFTFYLEGGSIIGSTLSGTTCTGIYETPLDTTSGVNYNWYATTTVSGNESVFTSDTYSFYVRYLCSGICYDDQVVASGINVIAHRRSTGELVGQTTTAGTGIFSIDSIYSEQHYVVALNPDENYNALIYDHVAP